MSEQSEQKMYREECDELSRVPRELGVHDLDSGELDELCRIIECDANTQIKATVDSIYVMGSFARGEARQTVSDLDLRVQVEPPVGDGQAALLERYMKVILGPELTPTKAGYLDAKVMTEQPPKDEPFVEVWKRAE